MVCRKVEMRNNSATSPRDMINTSFSTISVAVFNVSEFTPPSPDYLKSNDMNILLKLCNELSVADIHMVGVMHLA